MSYDGFWVTGLIKRRFAASFDDLDPVLEPRNCEQFRQLILSLQSMPVFGGGHDELEDHQPGGLRR